MLDFKAGAEGGVPAKFCEDEEPRINREFYKNYQTISCKHALTKISLWSELSDLKSRSIVAIFQWASGAEGGVLIL